MIALLMLSVNIIFKTSKTLFETLATTKIKTKLLSTCKKYNSIEVLFKVPY